MPPRAERGSRRAASVDAVEQPGSALAERPDDPPLSPGPAGRWQRHVGWRQLLIAGLIGACVGGIVPAVTQTLDSSAASGRVETLRTVADQYLTAIATGRAGVATALVPVEGSGRVAPDAVLQSAEPITDYSVQLVQVDGDSGSADVRYRVGGTEVFRSLAAQLIDDDWHLRTTLAEVADVRFSDPIVRVQVADVPLDDSTPLLLYPGSYTVDAYSGPFFLSGGDRFVVDGDLSTPTVPYVTAGVVPRIRDYATELALDTIADCQMRARCPVPFGLRLLPVGDPYPVDVDTAAGTIDLSVPIMALDGADTQWFDVRLRAILDDSGVPAEWRCGEPGESEALYRCSL